MTDVIVTETTIHEQPTHAKLDEQPIDNEIDELILQDIEPKTKSKRKTRTAKSTKEPKEPKEPKTPRARKQKIITVSVDNTTLEFDEPQKESTPTPPTPLTPPESPIPDIPPVTPVIPEPKGRAKAKAKPRAKKPKDIESDSMQVEQVNYDLGNVLTDDVLEKALTQRMLKIREARDKNKIDKYRELAEKAF